MHRFVGAKVEATGLLQVIRSLILGAEMPCRFPLDGIVPSLADRDTDDDNLSIDAKAILRHISIGHKSGPDLPKQPES
jgi:hypothetical protein